MKRIDILLRRTCNLYRKTEATMFLVLRIYHCVSLDQADSLVDELDINVREFFKRHAGNKRKLAGLD